MGYPAPGGAPAYNTPIPPAAGYNQPPAGYPQQGGQPGYPQPGVQPGYPQAPQPGYQQAGPPGYPQAPGGASGYPQGGMPGQAPPQAGYGGYGQSGAPAPAAPPSAPGGMNYAPNVSQGHNVTALGQGGAHTGYKVRVSWTLCIVLCSKLTL